MTLNSNTVIIGAGVAGMTSAIYLKRSNIDVIVLEKSAPGGQIVDHDSIENYPGFSKIAGADLALKMFDQIKGLGIEYRYGDVVSIKDMGDYKTIITDTEEITCKNIIIASGRHPRELGLPLEKELQGHGISYCAICDGPGFKDKVVAVAGGGNSAVGEARYLAGICKKVYLIHRRDHFRADAIEQDKLKKFDNIEIMFNSTIQEFKKENNQLSSILVKTNEVSQELVVDGLFIYIGQEPVTNYLKEIPINLDNDYVLVDDKMHTNIKGIYACGDVIKKEVYQISTAIGEASIAALSIKKDM